MLLIIGEENPQEQNAQFVKDHFSLFQDCVHLKWLKRKKLREGQIEWKVEGIVQSVFKI